MELCAIEWLPILLCYVIGSHFIPAASCYGFHFVKHFFHLTFVSPFLMSVFRLCTCRRLKHSRRSGALLNVAGPRSPFPLANMDLCAQDSVFFASFSFSSLSTLRPPLQRQTLSNVRTLKPEDFPVYKSL